MAELELLPFDEYVAGLPRKVLSAGVLLRDEQGRVLLVEPSYKPYCDIPGGVVEPGEGPWETAQRELYEETGLERSLGRLLVVDHVPAENDGLPERIAFVFDGGPVEERDLAGMRLGAEIVSVSLHTAMDMRNKVKPVLAARITAAVTAVENGETTMCQQGRIIS
ncbi:MAG TPA: NUDIX hydrolase [Actinophytocola sp.]|uniref:NUDIX hydrolase n=1 Tax=Actinophytocola sp. TaxID=1872138 RepID=UPI002DBF822E|nr:NUDIX hydrolase [Actinophytocola sp.]HEU5475833.1 NUDIX hydrolase [Actinophytocola sp.]